MTIPIPYYGDIKLNNNISFTLNFDMNDSKEFKSGDKIDLEEGAFSSNWKTGLRISYQFSNKISGGHPKFCLKIDMIFLIQFSNLMKKHLLLNQFYHQT